MDDIGARLLARLCASMPGSNVYWEIEPSSRGLKGAVLTAEYKNKKFTMQFESASDDPSAEALDDLFIEQIVDDFTDFFARTIYPKERFTRMI